MFWRLISKSIVICLFYSTVLIFPGRIDAAERQQKAPGRSPDRQLQNSPAATSQYEVRRGPARADAESRYLPGQLIVKFSRDVEIRAPYQAPGQAPSRARQNGRNPALTGIATLDAKLSKWKVQRLNRTFPHAAAASNPAAPDLSRIHTLYFSGDLDVEQVMSDLAADPNVEYAEPNYIFHPHATVNDPAYAQQLYLKQVKADSAWDISTGDRSVSIAVVDMGVDWDHEDLAANIWRNEDEAIGDANGDGFPGLAGIDDDGDGLVDEDSEGRQPGEAGYSNDLADDDDENGFIDDIRGWDFVDVPEEWDDADQPAAGEDGRDPDNDPDDFDGHGTYISGVAAAVTNNRIGIAGVTWNCSVMPVRVGYYIDPENAPIISTWAYRGIIYAADNGADIISLSWGSSSYSQANQDVVNYAWSKGAVIVASAGNSDNDDPHYPSSYDNVVSVAGTIHDIDLRWVESSYGLDVDLCAPATQIVTTSPNNQYAIVRGTSFSSPIVAGVAGLIKSLHPDWDNNRIVLQLLETADPIDDRNPRYRGLLGRGRVNAYRAVTESPSSLSIAETRFDDSAAGNGDGILDIGETVHLLVTVESLLDDVSDVRLTLSTDDDYITISRDIADFGSIPKDGSSSNSSAPFVFSSDPSTPFGHRVTFKLELSGNGGEYYAFKYFSVYIQPQFLDHDINNVTFTITSFGAYGYSDYADSEMELGSGFQYPSGSSSGLFLGSLWVGIAPDRVSDCSYGNAAYDNYDWITSVEGPLKIGPGVKSDQDGTALFNDSRAGNPIGIEVTQNSYAWSAAPDDDYVILEYTLENRSGADLQNVYVGLYMDWDIDISDGNLNYVGYDQGSRCGYMYSAGTNYYGVAMLQPEPTAYRAIDHDLFVYNNQLVDGNKYAFMRDGFDVIQSNRPYDWSHVLSTGPFSLGRDERRTVTYAVLGGDNRIDLLANAAAARSRYHPMARADIDIEHCPLLDTEDTVNPYTVNTCVTSGSDLVNPDAVFIMYRTGPSSSFNAVKMAASGGDQYSGQIPAQSEKQVEYYIRAGDADGRSNTLPYNAPDSLFSFFAGVDRIKPDIREVTLLENTLDNAGPYTVNAWITDNLGVDSDRVMLYFSVNESEADSVLMMTAFSGDLYEGEIAIAGGLENGDVVEYHVRARDRALQPNRAASEPVRFFVVNIKSIDDFESGLAKWDLGSGWGTNFYAHTGSSSLTDSPEGYYEPGSENILTLLESFNLKGRTSAALAYYYVHFLAAGDQCYVEASRDGVEWTALKRYEGDSNALFQEDAVSLSGFCGEGGESVRVRFRLVSDNDSNVGDGFYLDDVVIFADTTVTGLEDGTQAAAPRDYSLSQNYPNPFNPSTTLVYELPQPGYVTIEIYDLLGVLVRTLVDRQHRAGSYRASWDGRGNEGTLAPSGVYFYKMKAGSYVNTRKMILIK